MHEKMEKISPNGIPTFTELEQLFLGYYPSPVAETGLVNGINGTNGTNGLNKAGLNKFGVEIETASAHGLGTAEILKSIGSDFQTQLAGLLFGYNDNHASGVDFPSLSEHITSHFGAEVWGLIVAVRQLLVLRQVHSQAVSEQQVETLRRMLLAMVTDERVALIRLASRLQTLRWYALSKQLPPLTLCAETFDVMCPLANRLGLWQLKWELEDLAFRFSEPEVYKSIARGLDEKREARKSFVTEFGEQLGGLVKEKSVPAQLSGRPKHIYSIYKKMLSKRLTLEELSDLHAFRVVVKTVADCYRVLDAVQGRWAAVDSEYDDYIARPKSNGYQSLHTVVQADDGRPVEVQIRTEQMHEFAEFGVASHWRYKEGLQAGHSKKPTASQSQDQRVLAMRQILEWRRDVERTSELPPSTHVYALTPQARVIELPVGSTVIDFAYHVHSSLGHRCRGAKVNGQLVPLTTVVGNGQTVDIIASKDTGLSSAQAAAASVHGGYGGRVGPSRDWLNPALGFLNSSRARTKVRAWFNAIDEPLIENAGAVTKGIERGVEKPPERRAEISADDIVNLPGAFHKSSQKAEKSDILVVGVDFLMTQLAKCCRPIPPDEISGFVTRGRGISIHRKNCLSFKGMLLQSPERVLATAWGKTTEQLYPVDLVVRAYDRQGLLRDVSDTLARIKLNVIAVSTRSKDQIANMRFTVEVADSALLGRALQSLTEVAGVFEAKRK